MRRLLLALFAAMHLPTAAAQAQAAARAHTVRIEGMKFCGRIGVAAGDTIVWTNRDFLPHSVTATQAKVESGDLAPERPSSSSREQGEIKYHTPASRHARRGGRQIRAF